MAAADECSRESVEAAMWDALENDDHAGACALLDELKTLEALEASTAAADRAVEAKLQAAAQAKVQLIFEQELRSREWLLSIFGWIVALTITGVLPALYLMAQSRFGW